MKIPKAPPKIDNLFNELSQNSASSLNVLDEKKRYIHWDKLRFLSPPKGLTSERWWASIKWARKQQYRNIGLSDPNGKPFVFLYTDKIMEDLHSLDQMVFDVSAVNETLIHSHMQNTFLIRSLIEEAINSSQLEGASTTRIVAKEMLRQHRKATDKDEQMIYNNYIALQFIKDFKDEKLSPLILLELQKILTEKTLENENHAGRFRTKEDEVSVVSERGDILYEPPAANLLPKRIENLCSFANQIDSDIFIHPIIKAIILHFLLGYEHPFCDGNGRTARALFYWYMAKQNYRLMEFISISKIIKKAPVQYGLAYLYTETDENDLTYFISHQLSAIMMAVDELCQYIDKKSKEYKLTEEFLASSVKLRDKFNFRQLAIIKHAMKHPGFIYTIAGHQNTHGIAYDTARIDLLQLSDKYKLLLKEKKGKGFIFRSPQNLTKRIQETK